MMVEMEELSAEMFCSWSHLGDLSNLNSFHVILEAVALECGSSLPYREALFVQLSS